MPTYDVAAYQPTTSGTYEAALATATSSGRLLTGSEKLAQRFVMELLTEVGSMPFASDRGCTFVATLRSGGLYSEMDVQSAFYVALLSVSSNLQNEETDADPDDERFGSAELLAVSTEPGVVIMTVQIYSRASQSTLLTVPLVIIPAYSNSLDID